MRTWRAKLATPKVAAGGETPPLQMLASLRLLRHKPAFPNRPAKRAAVAVHEAQRTGERVQGRKAEARLGHRREQMPKMKTKSGAKKRFKITGTGKVMYAQRGKRHGMIKRTNKQIRNLRGTAVLFETDGEKVKKYWLPNG
jgi:large subunit ribosomal protein L35